MVAFSPPEAAFLLFSTRKKVQHRKSVNHGLPVTLRMLRVKSDKSDWLRVQNEVKTHAQEIGRGLRSRFLVLTKRSAASEDENEAEAWFYATAAYST